MVQFNFTYDPSISIEQRVGFELAAMIWSSYLSDDVEINLHIASSASLGEDGQAVGGAIPIFHEQNYGIYQEYLEADATSDIDAAAIEHLQEGNTVDFLVDGQVVDGNTDILLTSAQAKALGMDEALTLDNGGTWDRDLVDANALDGYILVSNAFEWNYDYTRSGDAPEGTLDFMSMALHEIGHQLGFVSGLDGALDLNQLYSGETQAAGFTALDLFRHSLESGEIINADGAVSDLSVGQNSYFSVDGGDTNLGNFSDGTDYQASHWARLQVAMGIMDPTLAYQERTSLGLLDLQAMDALGWDVNYGAINTGLDIDSLLLQAEQTVAVDLGLASNLLTDNRGEGEASNFYTLGYGELWQLFEKSMLSLGYGELWQAFELGYGELWQEYGQDIFKLGYGELWQLIEENIFNLGYGELWQSFESEMLSLGYGELWQQFETEMLELGYGQLWQKLDKFFATIDNKNSGNSSHSRKKADGGVGGQNAKTFQSGDEDDIIAGDQKQDRIKAGAGDDLIDGEGGHDVIWGEAGRDIIYGQDGNDLLYGGEGDDLLLGENDDDELHGEAGHDIVSGGSGDDIVTGGDGKDDLKGGQGNDVLSGGKGDDRLAGEADSDLLIGGEGRDQISGGSGNDVIYGDTYVDAESVGAESLKQLRTQLQARAASETSEPASSPTEINALNPIRVEAESMTLSGDAYIHTTWNNDSGDSVKTTGSSTSTTTFSGQSGSYMVVVRYFDEIGGTGKLDVGLNGTSLDSFDLNQETDHYYTRTVAQNITLNTGDEFTVTAIGDGADHAAFDYIEFIPLDSLLETPLEQVSSSSSSVVISTSTTSSEGTTSTSSTTTTETAFRVEAESMTLVGDYYREANSIASGGSLIAVSNQGEGKALSSFSGESGYYNIVVGYYDESGDGIAKISTSLGGTELDTWWLDQALSSSQGASTQSFTTRTVASTVFLQSGDLFELTGLRGEGNEDELARIDYVDFVKVDWANGGNNEIGESNDLIEAVPTTPIVLGEAIRVEAESMNLNGYQVESNSNPSGGQLIKTNASGVASTQFAGDTGYYNIVVAYYDENDGLSRISASLDGVALDEWQLDQNLGSNFISSNNRVTRTIATQIQIDTGDELRLEGLSDYSEFARIDYVEFVPVSAPAVPVTETSNDDFIQAGEGNDTVYGGAGNDTIYGESQADNSSSLLRGSQTYNGHTYLLSEKGTWEQAQIQAQQLGGNLVTLNDADEENWIRNIFSSTERLWTGFSDAVTEGEWQWVSGEAVTYTNWAPGEPNNIDGQDFGTINYNNQWDDTQLNGYWNPSEQKWYSGIRGVIEINTTDNDVLVGGSGHDTLYGNGGDDELYGDDQASGNNNSHLSNGLVGHWTFDETSGMHVGDSTGNNPGTLVNSSNPVWRAGQVGGALNFYGYADRVEVSDSASLDITDTLTLATWVKADTFESWDGLITKGQSNITYGLSFTSDGRLAFQANYGSVSGGNGSHFLYSNASLSIQEWQHVAVSYDGSNVQFYIDGQLDSSHQADITFGTNNEALLLGGDLTGSHLDGELDDARVYNRALNADEIAQLTTGEGSVVLSGEGGNDFLYGGIGSDTLEGGAGNDVLDGSDAIAAGYLEVDLLSGGSGADTFVLGNANQAYYIGQGADDYAVIQDFNAAEDIVQLHGAAGDYQQVQNGNDTYLSYEGDTSSELVAVFKNVSSVNFNSGFTFV